MDTSQFGNQVKRNIAIAHKRDIYDLISIEEKLASMEEENKPLQALYKKMIGNGSDRFLVQPSDIPSMDHLYEELPNFQGPLDDIKRQLALCINSGDPLEIRPLLLLGQPGTGKTHFAKMIAQILETKTTFVSMSSMTAGWILSGSSSTWKDAKPGKVFMSLVDDIFANPLIIVDEIDKASSFSQYDPLGPLYGLLERETAVDFVDEFADVPIDASNVIWITTANDESLIPSPILSRMDVHEILPPNQEQARVIALNIYRQMRTTHNWGQGFDETPNDDVIDVFSKTNPRDMKSMWMRSFGNAKLARRGFIKTEDLPKPKPKKEKIGF